MRRGLLVLIVSVLAGCGGGGSASPAPEPTPGDSAGSPNVIDLPAPAGTEAGREVATRAGCLACHVFGDAGNRGPGQDLTHVGAKLDRTQIERVLRNPPSPMPSFKSLPQEDFDALVDYMLALK